MVYADDALLVLASSPMGNQEERQSVYKLQLEGNGVSLAKDISESVARRIMTLAMGGASQGGEMFLGDSDEAPITDGATPKQFMALKRPISDVERVTCLAYYLTNYRKVGQFKTIDLTKLNVEAAQPRLSNATVAARNAVQQEYLSLAGGAKKQITSRGETVVDALPDRERVKRALDEVPARKRRSQRAVKKVGE